MTMESSDTNAPLSFRALYKSKILACLLSCFAISSILLPSFPSGDEQNNEKNDSNVIWAFILSAGAMLLLAFIGLRFILRRSHVHQKQEIFWPLRCSHCARAVRILKECPSPRTNRERNVSLLSEHTGLPFQHATLNLGDESDDSTTHFPKRSDLEKFPDVEARPLASNPESRNGLTSSVKLDDLPPLVGPHRSVSEMPTDENSMDVTDASLSISTHQNLQRLYSTPHKSLVKIFCMLEVVLVINLLCIMIGDIVCLGYGGTDIVLVFQCLHTFITISVHIVAAVFLCMYYDCVLPQRPKFCYFLAIALASFVWISAIKISNPTNALNNYHFYQLNNHCKMNGTLGSFITNDEIMHSFFEECGIVGAAMVWQLWSNMLPLSVLQLEGRQHALITFQSYAGIQGRAYSQKVLTFLKRFSNRKTLCRGGKSSENQSLLGCDPLKKMKRQLIKYYVLIFILCVSYSIVRFMINSGASGVSKNAKKYITWVCRMALNIPLLALLYHQAHVTTKANGFKLKRGVSILGELGSHDMILLLGCCGIFTLNILRLAGAVEIVFRAAGHADRKGDHLALASFGIIYTLFELFGVWVLTSFLITVQRQAITGVQEAKWTLLCLMYILISSATQWLGIFEGTHSFTLLCHAFGKSTGKTIGLALHPLASLYPLHSAMLAYETYTTVNSNLRHG